MTPPAYWTFVFAMDAIRVTYNDGGVKGETMVRMVTRNGRPMIDKIVRRDKGCR